MTVAVTACAGHDSQLGQQRRERLIPVCRGSIEAQRGEEIAPGHMVSQKMELGF